MTFIQWWASKLGKIEVVSESNFELMQEAYNTGQADQAKTIEQLEHALVSEAVNKKDYEQLQANNAKLRKALESIKRYGSAFDSRNILAIEALGERK